LALDNPSEDAVKRVASHLSKHGNGYNTYDIMCALQRALVNAPDTIADNNAHFKATVSLEKSAAKTLESFDNVEAMTDGLNKLCNNIHNAAAEISKNEDKAPIGKGYSDKSNEFRKEVSKLAKTIEADQKDFIAKIQELHSQLPQLLQDVVSQKVSMQQFTSTLQTYKTEFTRMQEKNRGLVKDQNTLWTKIEVVAHECAQAVIGEGVKMPKVDRPTLGN
jgi:chromosome segregation ATPase